MNFDTFKLSAIRYVGYALLSVVALVKLMVVLLVTLVNLTDAKSVDEMVDAYCDDAVASLECEEVEPLETTSLETDDVVSVNYTSMTWNELRAHAKLRGITTLKNKRTVLDSLHTLDKVYAPSTTVYNVQVTR